VATTCLFWSLLWLCLANITKQRKLFCFKGSLKGKLPGRTFYVGGHLEPLKDRESFVNRLSKYCSEKLVCIRTYTDDNKLVRLIFAPIFMHANDMTSTYSLREI
jgi:hypothetical protein